MDLRYYARFETRGVSLFIFKHSDLLGLEYQPIHSQVQDRATVIFSSENVNEDGELPRSFELGFLFHPDDSSLNVCKILLLLEKETLVSGHLIL